MGQHLLTNTSEVSVAKMLRTDNQEQPHFNLANNSLLALVQSGSNMKRPCLRNPLMFMDGTTHRMNEGEVVEVNRLEFS